MKKQLIITGLCLVLAVPSFAQQRQVGTPDMRAKRQTERMNESLNLTETQLTSVSAINLKYAREMQPILQDGERNLKTARQARDIMQRKDKEMKAVLDAAQYQQYEQMKEALRKEVKERRGRK
ncbi:hypothetical protein [Arsenicibacter rosenii]|uniref:DUF4890 domain-containing protein n=1 Tax=Arsenicibacter rosenii TaxID=1750698 RepID=A0A1S2VCU1_9BACT|nr:hypothetical protein [Arsenicibacter rosenii]OIN56240.1 hypothetical protein BLX24_25935 [Arsenicibacter rosenii]